MVLTYTHTIVYVLTYTHNRWTILYCVYVSTLLADYTNEVFVS